MYTESVETGGQVSLRRKQDPVFDHESSTQKRTKAMKAQAELVLSMIVSVMLSTDVVGPRMVSWTISHTNKSPK